MQRRAYRMCERLQAVHFRGVRQTPVPTTRLEQVLLWFRDMVRLTVALKAPAHRADGLSEALRFLRGSTLLEPGCLRCCVWVDPDSTVHCLEEWATEADLRRHVRSDRFASLLSVVESAPEPPHLQVDFVTATRGLEYIAELRHDLVEEQDRG